MSHLSKSFRFTSSSGIEESSKPLATACAGCLGFFLSTNIIYMSHKYIQKRQHLPVVSVCTCVFMTKHGPQHFVLPYLYLLTALSLELLVLCYFYVEDLSDMFCIYEVSFWLNNFHHILTKFPLQYHSQSYILFK